MRRWGHQLLVDFSERSAAVLDLANLVQRRFQEERGEFRQRCFAERAASVKIIPARSIAVAQVLFVFGNVPRKTARNRPHASGVEHLEQACVRHEPRHAPVPVGERVNPQQAVMRRCRRKDRFRAADRGVDLLEARPLYPYQRDGVERFFISGRLLLADDMGLGKTAQAIAACHALWHTSRVRRGLLVVPAALKSQWLREWQLFTDVPATVVDGTPSQRRAAFEACRRGFPLGNYEQLLRDLDIVREWTPDIIVLDEVQRRKAGESD
jgi:hypothetical protein